MAKAVKTLSRPGSDKHLKDKQGRTALDLEWKVKKSNILKIYVLTYDAFQKT